MTTIFQKLSFVKSDCCVLCFCILAKIRFEESAFKYCVLFSIETEGSAVLEWINYDKIDTHKINKHPKQQMNTIAIRKRAIKHSWESKKN